VGTQGLEIPLEACDVGTRRYGAAERISPVRLPRVREVRIPTDKLVRHTLGLTHERGRHQARVFASALGISSADSRYLHDQILEATAAGRAIAYATTDATSR
jgi:hypothetical protein